MPRKLRAHNANGQIAILLVAFEVVARNSELVIERSYNLPAISFDVKQNN